MFNPAGILLFVLIAVIPAYYLNKWMLKVTRPKESLLRLMIYFFLSVVLALAYSALFLFAFARFYPLPRK